MEEHVGRIWDRLVTRLARRDHPEAAVGLADVERTVTVMFRALGGDGGLSVAAATATTHGARRNWKERLAGIGERTELAWRDDDALYLPERIASLPTKALNRDLYLWLAALAAVEGRADSDRDWFVSSQARTRSVLQKLPGLQSRYERLVQAHCAERPEPNGMRPEEAECERAIRAALQAPGSVASLPASQRAAYPVRLWLHPSPPRSSHAASAADEADPEGGSSLPSARDRKRRQANRVDMPDGKSGLLLYRAEAIFALGDYVRARRGTEEDDAPSTRGADDLDALSIARDASPVASRVRFDLDLPAAGNDDAPLGAGVRLPEWDWRKRVLRPEHCCLQPMIAERAAACELPAALRIPARRLRRRFEALAPGRTWRSGAPDGIEPDIEALIRHRVERSRGVPCAEPDVYRQTIRGRRDLACLLLADLSLSTDAWVGNEGRVIDVIRDSLFLFAEALAATGDRCAIYGFSSRKREHVRFHHLKGFGERYDARVRGRIAAVKPGYYTRMGAALRHSANLLSQEAAKSRLLLLLTDGKPNDLDCYEGRYGIEDTRHAILGIRRLGLTPFCVTIDDEGATYLPHVFGAGNFAVVRRAQDLPRELPRLYAQLTQQS